MNYRNIQLRSVEDMTSFFKVLGDETRMRIVLALHEEGSCVGELADKLDMTDSAVSHQLRALRDARLVKARRSGKNVYYSLDDEHVTEIIETAYTHVEHQKR